MKPPQGNASNDANGKGRESGWKAPAVKKQQLKAEKTDSIAGIRFTGYSASFSDGIEKMPQCSGIHLIFLFVVYVNNKKHF